MRAKVSNNKKAKVTPLSLFPHQRQFAAKRAASANIAFSRYVQTLIDIDREKNILGAYLSETAKNFCNEKVGVDPKSA